MKDVILKEHEFNHPISDVWNAISIGKEISAWFIQADFEPEIGYKYRFTHEATSIIGEVKEANPYTLVYTWEIEGTGVETTVKWILEEKGESTLLKLEHSGISNYPDEQTAVKMFENFNGGWENCIGELTKYLNKEPHVA